MDDLELYAIFREASGGWILRHAGEFYSFPDMEELCEWLTLQADDEVEFWSHDEEEDDTEIN